MFRSELTAVQSAFQDGAILQIEVEHDDVRVYLKKGMGRTRIDTGKGFEGDLIAAAEKAREPQKC